jgi:hypothetical protein
MPEREFTHQVGKLQSALTHEKPGPEKIGEPDRADLNLPLPILVGRIQSIQTLQSLFGSFCKLIAENINSISAA